MATTIARRRCQRTRTHADHLRTAAPFFAVLAARHGVPAPDAPATAQTATQIDQDRAQAQDHLPGLEARP